MFPLKSTRQYRHTSSFDMYVYTCANAIIGRLHTYLMQCGFVCVSRTIRFHTKKGEKNKPTLQGYGTHLSRSLSLARSLSLSLLNFLYLDFHLDLSPLNQLSLSLSNHPRFPLTRFKYPSISCVWGLALLS